MQSDGGHKGVGDGAADGVVVGDCVTVDVVDAVWDGERVKEGV